MPALPPAVIMLPRFSAVPPAVISTRRLGSSESTSLTLLPAARITSPLGEVMMPLLVTSLPIRYTCPPCGVVICPWFSTLPATAPAWKFSLPARKSALEMFSVEAVRP